MARIKSLAKLYDALTTGMTLLPAGHIGYRHFRGDTEPPMLVYYESDIALQLLYQSYRQLP